MTKSFKVQTTCTTLFFNFCLFFPLWVFTLLGGRRGLQPLRCVLEYWNIALDASGVGAQAQTPHQQGRSLLQAAPSWSVLALQATTCSLRWWWFFSCFPLFWSSSQHRSNEHCHNPGLLHIYVESHAALYYLFFFFLEVSRGEQQRQTFKNKKKKKKGPKHFMSCSGWSLSERITVLPAFALP